MTSPADSAAPILAVRELSVGFETAGGVVPALDRVSFEVGKGRSVALVGESGCGKSSIAYAIMRLLPDRVASVGGGAIVFEGRDLLGLTEREMQDVRGARIGMIFQEPMTSLNPVYSVGSQIAEAVRLHASVSRSEARRRAIELLRKVGYPEPEQREGDYPHELSGGMRQRVLIAIALASSPTLLVADEPTTALDATIQAQILELLRRLKAELGMSLLLIAHDFAVVSELADEIVVLYAGQVIERGPTAAVLRSPRHPYTIALLGSVPRRALAARKHGDEGRRLPTIEGAVPDLRVPPAGCRFQPRCPSALARCKTEAPPLITPPGAPDVAVRCVLFEPGREDSAAARSEEPIPLSNRTQRAEPSGAS
ncbi:MAG TPA: ABC transporter ATP-binding protein [Polyangiaceae bacterium]